MTISELINEIDDIIKNLYNFDVNIYEKIGGILPEINARYTEFIELIPRLNEIGMDISMDIVVGQLSNLSSAIEMKDKVELYDTFKYEIIDTLGYYNEILNIMNEQ